MPVADASVSPAGMVLLFALAWLWGGGSLAAVVAYRAGVRVQGAMYRDWLIGSAVALGLIWFAFARPL